MQPLAGFLADARLRRAHPGRRHGGGGRRRDGSGARGDGRRADAVPGEVRRLPRGRPADRRRPPATAARSSSRLAREDAEAYEHVVRARRLPRERRRRRRSGRPHRGSTTAARPRSRCGPRGAPCGFSSVLPELVEKGNPNAASDAGTAALLLEAAAEAALLNVGINLSGSADGRSSPHAARDRGPPGEAQRLRSQVLAAVRQADSAPRRNSRAVPSQGVPRRRACVPIFLDRTRARLLCCFY